MLTGLGYLCSIKLGMQYPDCTMIDPEKLLSRIAQLEQERDELHGSAGPVSTLQNGILVGLDFVSRFQGRRASGSEQELESCHQKLAACRKENSKLQEELSEVYLIKSKFAELLKMEVEKTAGLENEVKFFQVQAATALSDRDGTFLEIERLRRKKDAMIEKVTDLQNRLDHITSEYTEEKSLCETLFMKLEKVKDENDSYKKLVEKFWTVREQGVGTSNSGHIQERATILLQDPDGLWSYGEKNTKLHEQEIKESLAEKQEEDARSCCGKQLVSLAELALDELQQLKSCQRSLSQYVCALCSEEGKWMQEAPQKFRRVDQLPSLDDGNVNLVGSDWQQNHDEFDEADSKFSCNRETSEVSALLLLSQQEERHILETNTTHVLESQISSLKQQLVQVTKEKMDGLMELAHAQEKNQKLQVQQKFMQRNWVSGEQEVPSSDDGPNSSSFSSNIGKRASVQDYLKHLWPRGREYVGPSKSLVHMLSLRGKEDDGESSTRLLTKGILRQRSFPRLQ